MVLSLAPAPVPPERNKSHRALEHATRKRVLKVTWWASLVKAGAILGSPESGEGLYVALWELCAQRSV